MVFCPEKHLDKRFLSCAKWAVECGKILIQENGGKGKAFIKKDGHRVTQADYDIENYFLKMVNSYFSDDLFYGEEGEDFHVPAVRDRYCWFIDPVDGTNNYFLGIPFFSIAVGIFRDGLPEYGIVYDPVHDDIFAARRKRGSWLNGKRLKVQTSTLTHQSNLAVRTPFTEGVPFYAQSWFTKYKLRWMGSTALQICYCATGAIAAVIDHKATLWDIAGASLVLMEAGGYFTDFQGKNIMPLHLQDGLNSSYSFVASPPGVHETITEETRK